MPGTESLRRTHGTPVLWSFTRSPKMQTIKKTSSTSYKATKHASMDGRNVTLARVNAKTRLSRNAIGSQREAHFCPYFWALTTEKCQTSSFPVYVLLHNPLCPTYRFDLDSSLCYSMTSRRLSTHCASHLFKEWQPSHVLIPKPDGGVFSASKGK